jgi:hypothetical protein
MKKVTFVALSLLASVTFTSCGGNGKTEATPVCDTCKTAADTTKVVNTPVKADTAVKVDTGAKAAH